MAHPLLSMYDRAILAAALRPSNTMNLEKPRQLTHQVDEYG